MPAAQGRCPACPDVSSGPPGKGDGRAGEGAWWSDLWVEDGSKEGLGVGWVLGRKWWAGSGRWQAGLLGCALLGFKEKQPPRGRGPPIWLGGATVQLGSGDSLTLLSSWPGTRLPCSGPFLQEALLTSRPTTVSSSRASPLSPLPQPRVALSVVGGSSSFFPVASPHPEPKAGPGCGCLGPQLEVKAAGLRPGGPSG